MPFHFLSCVFYFGNFNLLLFFLLCESHLVVSDSVTPWTIQSMEFSRPEYCSWVMVPFSRGSSQPRDQTQVSHIATGFFTRHATREAQEYWSEQPR